MQLGVLGSALGTVLAQGITMLVTLYLLAKMDRQEEEPVSLISPCQPSSSNS
nr:hypothetical protein [Lactobacillus delbrueckii]